MKEIIENRNIILVAAFLGFFPGLILSGLAEYLMGHHFMIVGACFSLGGAAVSCLMTRERHLYERTQLSDEAREELIKEGWKIKD